jgi:hypothetical protein
VGALGHVFLLFYASTTNRSVGHRRSCDAIHPATFLAAPPRYFRSNSGFSVGQKRLTRPVRKHPTAGGGNVKQHRLGLLVLAVHVGRASGLYCDDVLYDALQIREGGIDAAKRVRLHK